MYVHFDQINFKKKKMIDIELRTKFYFRPIQRHKIQQEYNQKDRTGESPFNTLIENTYI